jgi:uncharacterized protein (UPF0335 family)
MAKRSKKNKEEIYNVAALQPDELNALKAKAREYVDRMQNLDNEIKLLQEDKVALREEFSEQLDLKMLDAVLRVLKIESKVDHKDTYDCFYEALKTDV